MQGVGGREMLEYVERPDPTPGPGEALVEIADRVPSVGEGVQGLSIGQRVAWVYAPGRYAARIAIPTISRCRSPMRMTTVWPTSRSRINT
jgi:NADPH2:quinone reductase